VIESAARLSVPDGGTPHASWPYLVLNEADVALDVAQLRAAGVKAVALLAGESDIDALMADAVSFVLAEGDAGAPR
jgi:hypothetical protein